MIIFGKNICQNTGFDYEINFDNLLSRLNNNDPSIIDLDIRGDLQPGQFSDLFRSLTHNSTVKSLILRGKQYSCDLSNELIYTQLSALLHNNRILKSLELYHTNVTDDAVDCIISALPKNNILEYLKICGHNMSDKGRLNLDNMRISQKDVTSSLQLDYEGFNIDLFSGKLFARIDSIKVDNLSVDYMDPWFQKYHPDKKYDTVEQKLHFIELLEKVDFPRTHIDQMQLFFDDLFTKEEELQRQYNQLQETFKASKDFTPEAREQFKKSELDLIEKYNKIQIEAYKGFSNLWTGLFEQDTNNQDQSEIDSQPEDIIISELEEEAEAVKEDIISTSDESVAAQLDSKLSDTDDKESIISGLKEKSEDTLFTSVPKKLDIKGNNPGDCFLDWVQQVTKNDYEFAVISVGSGLDHENQQIPPLTEKLGKVAIINIDTCFTESEMVRESASDDVSVNYLKGKIKGYQEVLQPNAPEYLKKARQESDEINNKISITQEDLKERINDLIDSGKKVVLLSHISPIAPILFFEQVLIDEKIMNNYGDNFIFINSYFDDCPTILCSKNGVLKMMVNHEDFNQCQEDIFNMVENIFSSSKGDDVILNSETGNVFDNLSCVQAYDILALMDQANNVDLLG